jgi:hypothetical protein
MSHSRVVTGPVQPVQSLDQSGPGGHRPVEKACQTGKNREKLTGLFDHLLSIKWIGFKKNKFLCFLPRF